MAERSPFFVNPFPLPCTLPSSLKKMPLLKEWEPDPHSLAAIWKIDEEEAFFTAGTGVDATHINHPKRRLEHLAGRYLLQHLKEDFPLHHIAPDVHDKPRIPEDKYRFSISHSFPYVAAQISDTHECGIDIQTWHRGMEALQDKFLSPGEQEAFSGNTAYLHLAWCAKEAAYKWNGRRSIDFIEHMRITSFLPGEECYHFALDFHNEHSVEPLSLQAFLTDAYALAMMRLP